MLENRQSEPSKAIWHLMSIGFEKGWRFISSELTLAEVLTKPIADAKLTGNWALVDAYRFSIQDKANLQTIVPVSRAVLDMAADVRSENGSLRLPDAIHLATALSEACSVFVTNDLRFAAALRKHPEPKQFDTILTFLDLPEFIARA